MGDVTAKYLEIARNKISQSLSEKTGNYVEVTDYKLGKLLGISNSAMHYYLKDDRECDNDDIIFSIAHFAQIDPMQIIGAIRAKKAKTNEVKDFWSKVSKGAVAGVGAVGLTSLLSLSPAAQNTDLPGLVSSDNTIYYVKLNIA